MEWDKLDVTAQVFIMNLHPKYWAENYINGV